VPPLELAQEPTQNPLLLPFAASLFCNIRHIKRIWRKRVGVEPKHSTPKSRRMMTLRLPPSSNWSQLESGSQERIFGPARGGGASSCERKNRDHAGGWGLLRGAATTASPASAIATFSEAIAASSSLTDSWCCGRTRALSVWACSIRYSGQRFRLGAERCPPQLTCPQRSPLPCWGWVNPWSDRNVGANSQQVIHSTEGR